MDSLLGGRLRLHQSRTGHRAGTDAVLLAACVPDSFQGSAVDVGAGVGAAGLCVLSRHAAVDMTFLEVEPDLASVCAVNIESNGFAGSARAVEADLLVPKSRRAAGIGDGVFDLVLTNPPFYESGAVRASPDPKKARAHVSAGLAAWMKSALALLAPGGVFFMIHRADALPGILEAAGGRIGGLRIMPVHARADEPAIRVLVGGRKGSRAPLELLPSLTLHEGSRFSDRSEAIHRGEALIDLRIDRRSGRP